MHSQFKTALYHPDLLHHFWYSNWHQSYHPSLQNYQILLWIHMYHLVEDSNGGHWPVQKLHQKNRSHTENFHQGLNARLIDSAISYMIEDNGIFNTFVWWRYEVLVSTMKHCKESLQEMCVSGKGHTSLVKMPVMCLTIKDSHKCLQLHTWLHREWKGGSDLRWQWQQGY